MFIDSPRDHSVKHLAEMGNYATGHAPEEVQMAFYDEKEVVKTTLANAIKHLSVAKAPLVISISGEYGTPLKISVKTPDTSFDLFSTINLAGTGTESISYEMILKRLKAINDTEYYIEKLTLENLRGDVFLPFKELTSMKKRVLFILNGSKEFVAPVDVPVLKNQSRVKIKPTLSVLISSLKDLHLCDETSAEICFQLPGCLKNNYLEFIDLFITNKKLIPWFPSVLIGEDYTAAVALLQTVHPKLIVTNNTGIAYEAFSKGIDWIAGPYLNIANSFSLTCLKEVFNCCGSFISNEISRSQIRQIHPPEDFRLFYSICHPIVLMTSRQCLFHQVTGCEKDQIDDACIQRCERSSTITNLKKETFYIEKSKGNYHCIYDATNFLNTDLVTDIPDLFSGFLIDLRDVKTGTQIETDKSGVIKLFEELLDGDPGSEKKLKQMIHPSTNAQYLRGI